MKKLTIRTEKKTLSKDFIRKHLDRLEELVDLKHLRAVEQKQLNIFQFEPVDRLAVMVTMRDDVSHKSVSHVDWPFFSFDQMWNDYGSMLLNELQPIYESVHLKDDKVFTVRPNLSQIVIPSMFGVEGSFSMVNEDSMPFINKPPKKKELLKIIRNGIEYEKHWSIVKYCEIIDTWREILSGYQNLQQAIHFSLPDIQGPFNIYFLLRGSEAYLDLFDEPDLTHGIMAIITNVLIRTTHYLAEYLSQRDVGYYWNYNYLGMMRNVDDNSILLSREHYLEFVNPYNTKFTEKCGGDIHHFCGNGDHVIDIIMKTSGIRGLNFGNPELQDLDMVYAKALENRVVLLWDRQIPHQIFNKLAQGIIMKIVVTTLEEGRKKLAEYRG